MSGKFVLTGKAARTTLLTSLAILIFLFVFPVSRFPFIGSPRKKPLMAKPGCFHWAFGFKLLESSIQDTPDHAIQKQDIFSYKGLPSPAQTKSGMIIWQIISYNYSMRATNKIDMG